MSGKTFCEWVEVRLRAQQEEAQLKRSLGSLLTLFKSETERLEMSLDDVGQGLLILFEDEHNVEVLCGKPDDRCEELSKEGEIGFDKQYTVWVARCEGDLKLRVYYAQLDKILKVGGGDG